MAAITGLVGTASRVSSGLQYKGGNRIFSSSSPAPLASAISESSGHLRSGDKDLVVESLKFQIAVSDSGEGRVGRIWMDTVVEGIDKIDELKEMLSITLSPLLLVLNPILAFLSQNSAGYEMLVVPKTNGLRFLSGVSLDNFQEGIDFRSYESRAVLRLMCFDEDSRGANRMFRSGNLIPNTCIMHPDTFGKWAGGLIDHISTVLGGGPSGLFLGQVPEWQRNHEAMNQLIFLWSKDPESDNASYAEFALDPEKSNEDRHRRLTGELQKKRRRKSTDTSEVFEKLKAENQRRNRNKWITELLNKTAFDSGRLNVVLPTHFTSLPIGGHGSVQEIVGPKPDILVEWFIKGLRFFSGR